MLAAEVIGLAQSLKVRSIPLWPLRCVAATEAILGLVSRKSRRSAEMLGWMIYSSTHDAIAVSCGKRRLYEEFCSKRDALRLAV